MTRRAEHLDIFTQTFAFLLFSDIHESVIAQKRIIVLSEVLSQRRQEERKKENCFRDNLITYLTRIYDASRNNITQYNI